MDERSLVIVGESNPYGGDPAMALYHLPREASGNRLRQILGLRDATYAKLHKVNLCEGPWRLQAARQRAMQLISDEGVGVLILLGTKVRQAFRGPEAFSVLTSPYGRHYIGLPHPSGLNRTWLEPDAVERARATVGPIVPWLPIGETEE